MEKGRWRGTREPRHRPFGGLWNQVDVLIEATRVPNEKNRIFQPKSIAGGIFGWQRL
jgi:hypothetical protein